MPMSEMSSDGACSWMAFIAVRARATPVGLFESIEDEGEELPADTDPVITHGEVRAPDRVDLQHDVGDERHPRARAVRLRVVGELQLEDADPVERPRVIGIVRGAGSARGTNHRESDEMRQKVHVGGGRGRAHPSASGDDAIGSGSWLEQTLVVRR